MNSRVENISTRTSPNKNALNYNDNRGKRWTTEEDNYLLQQIQFLSYYDIGRHLKRSENAVVSRIKKLAFHMIQGGEDPEIVKNNLKLSDDDIDQINSECFIFNQKNNPAPNKFIISMKNKNKKGYFNSVTPPSPEMTILIEIKSMLRRLLHQNDVKSPQKERMKISEINLEDLEKRSEEFAKSN